MSYLDIPGWSHEIIPFYEMMAKRLPHNGVFVEVGTFLGRSLACMGELRPDLELWAIDPWADGESQGYAGAGIFADDIKPYGSLWRAFLGLMQKHSPDVLNRVHIIRAKSHQIIPVIDADMVFIDGAHDYDSVATDIMNFRQMVKPGGIISGHDYHPDFAGLVKAVDEAFVGKPNLEGGPLSCWWVRK